MPVSNNNVKSDDLCIKCLVSVLSAKINFLKKEVQFIPYPYNKGTLGVVQGVWQGIRE